MGRTHRSRPAIPVGHHVELTWRERTGWRGKTETRPFEPALIDLDTGVHYAPMWQLGSFDGYHSGRVNAYATDPLPDLPVHTTMRGRVRACTIVHLSLSEPCQQTLLVLDELPIS